jgi:hypothetical protein
MTRLLHLLLAVVSVSACTNARVNSTCAWADDRAYPLDITNPDDQQHLIEDAQLAEDLAIRFADLEHGRLYGYHGHGGLVRQRQTRAECMASLVAVIKTHHGVTSEQIAVARRYRNPVFDLAVALSFASVYWIGAVWACRGLVLRFRDDARAALVALAIASLPISTIGVLLGGLWFGAAEIIRVGNDHLSSFREARHLGSQHLPRMFIVGVALFGLAGVRQLRHITRNGGTSDPHKA